MPTDSQPTVLLVGLGNLGGVLLEFLAREEGIGRIVACSRSRSEGEARCNLARISIAAQGNDCHIEYRRTDVSDPERFAETVRSAEPDLILGAATMQTWWLTDLLPVEKRDRLQQARFGCWLPLHLAPTRSFMEGVRLSGFRGPVLTAPFPDVVNCILERLGLAPTCGIGNVDEIAAKVRLLAAQQLGDDLEAVQVRLVGHHALEAAAFGDRSGGTPPYHLQIHHRGADVTHELDTDGLLFASYPLPRGPAGAFLTAGSTLRLIRALLWETKTPLHSPSPAGLPGGYPVLAGGGEIEVALPDACSLQTAIEINERSHPFDGVQSIEPDGTAVFVPASAEILADELGYDCSRLPADEAAARARELAAKFKEYSARNGVDLDRVP